MSNIFSSTIGKKLIMSISGLFLVLFLVVHLTVNSFLLIPDGGRMFNAAAHFMVTNPLIRVIEPLLAIGFIVHILWASIITLENRKAHGPIYYKSGKKSPDVTWASQNMYVLGVVILAFLIVHVANFYLKMRLLGDPLLAPVTIDVGGVATEVENSYALVNATFGILWIVVVYLIGFLGLGLHLSHGFWSGFQTLGFSNDLWRKRLTIAGNVFAWLIGIGFSAIAVLQYLFYQG